MEIIKIIESFAVIVASLCVVYGIGSWRREMKERKEYEIAEEVLALFYEANDRIRAIRSPFGFIGEGQSRKPEPNETPEQKIIRDRAYVVFERYKNNQEVFNRLHALRYRFIVIFGKDKAMPFNNLRKILSKILSAADILSNGWEKKYEDIIWEKYPGSDSISNEVDKTISEIENICENTIRPVPWFSKILKKLKHSGKEKDKK